MALSAAAEKQAIIDLMQKTTVEVTPGGAAKVADFSDILRAGCTVYVTFLPGSDFADTVKTVRRLKDEGFNPVPHFAAPVRTIWQPSNDVRKHGKRDRCAQGRVGEIL